MRLYSTNPVPEIVVKTRDSQSRKKTVRHLTFLVTLKPRPDQQNLARSRLIDAVNASDNLQPLEFLYQLTQRNGI